MTEPSHRLREPRRFFLDEGSDEEAPRLAPEEERHAATVLRMRPGDPILGLDGRGRAWPLTIESVRRTTIQVVRSGPPEMAPAAGHPGSPIPEVCLALSLPTANHLESLVDRLTQIGVARIAPFVAAHTPVRSRTMKPKLEQRLERIVRTACKQSRRLWVPKIEALRPLADWLAAPERGPSTFLAPGAQARLADWCASTPVVDAETGVRRMTLFVGPEGGFEDAEQEAFHNAQPPVVPSWLGPHIMRIETASEAAAAVALHHCTLRADREPG